MIEDYVFNFRHAIEKAKEEGVFSGDISFQRFPCGCCGDASDLLAQYLLSKGIKTWYVCGTHYPVNDTKEEDGERVQSHAWLTTNDPRRTNNYLVIDITGDQFRDMYEYCKFDKPVYIGPMDRFHLLFEVEQRDVYESQGIDSFGEYAASRLWKLYQFIIERL